MTVDELIGKLQQMDSPDLEVWVPCPHCCGLSGADFDLLDEEFVQATERDGKPLAVIGDPGQECLGDRRHQSKRRVKETVGKDISAIAAGLGLEHVRTFNGQEDLRTLMPREMGPRAIINRASHLAGSSIVVETKKQGATEYIIMETPYRATQDDVDRVMRNCRLLRDVTGCRAEAVIASVKRERGLTQQNAEEDVHWHDVSEDELGTPERS